MESKIRVAIDCRNVSVKQGVGTAVLVLAKTLSESEYCGQEYSFVTSAGSEDWLRPYVYGPCRLAITPGSTTSSMKQRLSGFAPALAIAGHIRRKQGYIPVSDGYVEAQGFDLVHFPTQVAYRTKMPSIYQPWDLQHRHYPEFFSKVEFARREREYRAFCEQATVVCVQTEWTRRDVIAQYGVDSEKIAVIPWGSVFDAYAAPSPEDVAMTVNKHDLRSPFFFYPAVTWPHKNHRVILDALKILQLDGSFPHVCFTGAWNDYRPKLDAYIKELGLGGQVHFLGFLSPAELQAIFAEATAMIFPSRFEGFGLPILEAFHARLPVLAARATTLPEVACEAALYFDPDSPEELARLMQRMLKEPELRSQMIEQGSAVLGQYSIRKTVESFQALYNKVAAMHLANSLCAE